MSESWKNDVLQIFMSEDLIKDIPVLVKKKNLDLLYLTNFKPSAQTVYWNSIHTSTTTNSTYIQRSQHLRRETDGFCGHKMESSGTRNC
jgi:hypothetical protein